MKLHPIIDKNIESIREKALTKSSNSVRKELGINCATWYRYIRHYDIKFVEMKESLRCTWTPDMIRSLKIRFKNSFNAELAKDLRVSVRTLIRKARELGLQKEEEFLDKRRSLITEMAKNCRPKNDAASIDRITQAGIPYRFKKGHKPVAKDYNKIWQKRRENQKAIKELLKNPY